MADKENDVICHCSGTTKGRIKALIDNKINDLDSLSRMTGACSGCGSCETSLLALLAVITDAIVHPALRNVDN